MRPFKKFPMKPKINILALFNDSRIGLKYGT